MKMRTDIALVLAVFCLLAVFPGTAAARPVTLVDFSWDSVQIHNRIAAYIIEKGYGKETDFIFAESLPGMMGIERGDADLSMEGWVDNLLEYWEKATSSGKMVSLGTNFPDAPQGWYVPTYMIKGDEKRGIKPVAPDLKSVADLPKYWELFKDPENPKKGRLLNGPAGWKVTSINEMKIRGYGLDKYYDAFSAGSETALSTAIKRAYDRGEPVLAYYWEPTWVMGLLDMTMLEEPPYDEKLWNDENLYACAIPSVRVLVVANTKFVEANPDIVAFLKNYTTTLEQNNRVLAFMFETKADTQKAAVWFLKNYEDVWKAWVPADVADKVAAALKEEK
ncbi:MAG: glycine betaine/proline transport system substrate-binding protein [Synergistaceae bacterium]|jgi:glycine betaine/proline transport system substrate-binding protein|nr:glycine betaine/proline transport system substrate-binding protein [Synergistaceae bacterium]